MHTQSDTTGEATIAFELYIHGATHGDCSAWVAVAIAVTNSGRTFQGAWGVSQKSTRDLPAGLERKDTNIDAELSAMVIATAFAYFWSVEVRFVIRPDLALSKRYFNVESTSRQDSTIAKVVHILGQPANIEVSELRAHFGDPWNELADSVAKLVAKSRTEVGRVPWKILNQIAGYLIPIAKHCLRYMARRSGSHSHLQKNINARGPNDIQISLKVATYNGWP